MKSMICSVLLTTVCAVSGRVIKPFSLEKQNVAATVQESATYSKSADGAVLLPFRPMENKDLFEGDIEIDGNFDRNHMNERDGKAAAEPDNGRNRWPNAQIPFVISSMYTGIQVVVILNAIVEIQDHSCIRFVPRTNEPDFINIRPTPRGCSSSVGRRGGEQTVSLNNDVKQNCMYKGIVMHELMHAIGFWHEQSRADRDAFVRIFWENIRDGEQHNFEKYDDTVNFGLAYDITSIMHYGAKAFSKNGLDTINGLDGSRPVDPGAKSAFSASDIRALNSIACPGK